MGSADEISKLDASILFHQQLRGKAAGAGVTPAAAKRRKLIAAKREQMQMKESRGEGQEEEEAWEEQEGEDVEDGTLHPVVPSQMHGSILPPHQRYTVPSQGQLAALQAQLPPSDLGRASSSSSKGKERETGERGGDPAASPSKPGKKGKTSKGPRSNGDCPACDRCRRRKERCVRPPASDSMSAASSSGGTTGALAPCIRCVQTGSVCELKDTLLKRGPPSKEEIARFREAGVEWKKYRSRIKEREQGKETERSPTAAGSPTIAKAPVWRDSPSSTSTPSSNDRAAIVPSPSVFLPPLPPTVPSSTSPFMSSADPGLRQVMLPTTDRWGYASEGYAPTPVVPSSARVPSGMPGYSSMVPSSGLFGDGPAVSQPPTSPSMVSRQLPFPAQVVQALAHFHIGQDHSAPTFKATRYNHDLLQYYSAAMISLHLVSDPELDKLFPTPRLALQSNALRAGDTLLTATSTELSLAEDPVLSLDEDGTVQIFPSLRYEEDVSNLWNVGWTAKGPGGASLSPPWKALGQPGGEEIWPTLWHLPNGRPARPFVEADYAELMETAQRLVTHPAAKTLFKHYLLQHHHFLPFIRAPDVINDFERIALGEEHREAWSPQQRRHRTARILMMLSIASCASPPLTMQMGPQRVQLLFDMYGAACYRTGYALLTPADDLYRQEEFSEASRQAAVLFFLPLVSNSRCWTFFFISLNESKRTWNAVQPAVEDPAEKEAMQRQEMTFFAACTELRLFHNRNFDGHPPPRPSVTCEQRRIFSGSLRAA